VMARDLAQLIGRERIDPLSPQLRQLRPERLDLICALLCIILGQSPLVSVAGWREG